jgi:hypothetical protein
MGVTIHFRGSASRDGLAGHLDACFRAINDQLISQSDGRARLASRNTRLAALQTVPLHALLPTPRWPRGSNR